MQILGDILRLSLKLLYHLKHFLKNILSSCFWKKRISALKFYLLELDPQVRRIFRLIIPWMPEWKMLIFANFEKKKMGTLLLSQTWS